MTKNTAAKKLISDVQTKREALGYSIRALSKQIGISFSTLARAERGQGVPDEVTLKRMQEWLAIDRQFELITRAARRETPYDKLQKRVGTLEQEVLELKRYLGR